MTGKKSASIESQRQTLETARRALAILEDQVAGYTSLTVPPHLVIDLENKRQEVAGLEKDLETVTQTPDHFQPEQSQKKNVSVWIGIAAILVCIAGILVLFLRLGSGNFSYQVRVQREGTGEIIKDAKVIIEVAGSAPLIGYTDSNGYAQIFIDATYAKQPGRLRVEATGYEPYWKEMRISKGSLPEIIYLAPLP